MEIEIKVTKKIKIGTILKIIEKMEPYIIDYMLDFTNLTFQIFTIPMNITKVQSIFLEHTLVEKIRAI